MTNSTLTRFLNSGLLDDWTYSPRTASRNAVRPNIDIVDSDKSITIVADAPGYDVSDINIQVEDDVLTISGKRRLEKNETNQTFTRRERTEESFTRSFTLDDKLDVNKIKANLKDGVLKVDIPKIEQAVKKPLKIGVERG